MRDGTVVKWLALMLHIQEASVQNSWFSLLVPGKFCDGTLKQDMIPSFHISNTPFTDHPTHTTQPVQLM
jgi:hypothetical protein